MQPEAVGNGDRVLPNSSASSPSEAYAGLCLDSVEEPTAETTTGMTADISRRDSLTRGKKGATVSNTSATNVNGDATRAEGTRSRSQSPAKRRAEEMEDGNGADELEQMEVDGDSALLQNGQSSTATQPVCHVFPLLSPHHWRVALLQHSFDLAASYSSNCWSSIARNLLTSIMYYALSNANNAHTVTEPLLRPRETR